MGRQLRPGYAPVAFRERFWNEDLERASVEGRRVAQAARQRLEGQGVGVRSELRPFDPDRPLYLENCAKLYLPQPGGAWRLVLEAARDPETGDIVWVSLAFGVGHLPERSGRWNAYEFAYRRLYDRDSPRAR